MLLSFVTDRRVYSGDERSREAQLLEAVGAAARAGVDIVQIRERDLAGRQLLALVRSALERIRGTTARLLVNDRVDVAIASGAHGVHLRGDSIPVARVRAIAPSLFVGRSVHSSTEAHEASSPGGCDYLIAGTVFATPSKQGPHALLGLDGLRRICATTELPVLAIGGMTLERAADAVQAGAGGIAGIRLFADPTAVGERVARLRSAFDT